MFEKNRMFPRGLMDTACLIPARYNSSRFPGKLLAVVQGKTILQRTIESALQFFTIEQIFVATDDERIFSHVQTLGVQPIWTSQTCLTGTDRIAETVLKCPALSETPILVNLQGDHPCTSPETLRAAIEILKSDPEAAISTVASPIRSLKDFYAPHIVKVVIDLEGNALYFSRSPIPYCKEGLPKKALHHIGLYCFRRSFLLQYPKIAPTPLHLIEDLEQLKILEKRWRIKVAVVDEPALSVDVHADLARLEEHLSNENRTCRSNIFS